MTDYFEIQEKRRREIITSIKIKAGYWPQMTMETHKDYISKEIEILIGTWVRKCFNGVWHRIFVFECCILNPLNRYQVVETLMNRFTHSVCMVQTFYKQPIEGQDEKDCLQISEEERLNPVK